jgi:hypothetical protein
MLCHTGSPRPAAQPPATGHRGLDLGHRGQASRRPAPAALAHRAPDPE